MHAHSLLASLQASTCVFAILAWNLATLALGHTTHVPSCNLSPPYSVIIPFACLSSLPCSTMSFVASHALALQNKPPILSRCVTFFNLILVWVCLGARCSMVSLAPMATRLPMSQISWIGPKFNSGSMRLIRAIYVFYAKKHRLHQIFNHKQIGIFGFLLWNYFQQIGKHYG